MVTYFIGQGDGNREILEGIIALEPSTAPSYRTNFQNAGGSTLMVLSATLEPLSAPEIRVRSVDPDLVVTPSLLGGLLLPRVSVTGEIIVGAALTGPFSLSTSIQGAVYIVPLLDGDVPTQIIPIPTPDFLGEQNDNKRPCLPWQIAAFVSSYYAISEDGGATFKFDTLEPFAVADDFSNDPDDLLTQAGGLAGYIGLVIETASGKGLRFRPPFQGETIVRTSDSAVFRWDEAMGKWMPHTTLPQRSMNDMQVFQMLDADGIYDYYAAMLGLTLAQHQYDTKRLLDLVDPVSCPDRFLSLLLHTFGADDVEFETSPEGKRELLRTFIGIMKIKGTGPAIVTAIASLGLQGYGTHVWVIPNGQPEDIIEKPFGFDAVQPTDGNTEYFPSSQINIHLTNRAGNPIVIDDELRQRVARFLKLFVLPTHVQIKWFVTDQSAGTDSLTVADAASIT